MEDFALRACRDTCRVFLYKLRVGHDEEVIKHLEAVWEDDDPNVLLLHALGEWDVVVITKGKPSRVALRHSGTIPHILNAVEVICDEISLGDTHFPNLREGSLVSLTVARFDRLYSDETISERVFLEWWQANGHAADPNLMLLATLGGPQFVIVRNNQDLDDFRTWMDATTADLPHIRGTYSLLTLAEETAKADSTCDQPSLGWFPPDAIFQLHMSWATRSRNRIRELARARFVEDKAVPNADWIQLYQHAGARDFTLSISSPNRNHGDAPPPRVSLLGIIQSMFRLRNDAGSAVFATETSLQMPCEEIPLKANRPTSDYFPFFARLESHEAARIDSLEEVGHRVLQFLYFFSDLLDDEAVAEDLADAAICWSRIKRTALSLHGIIEKSGKAQPAIQGLRRLSELVHLVQEGVHQRLLGPIGPTPAMASSLPRPIGSVNRVLQAATAIPMLVIAQIADRKDSGFQNWSGIINLGPFRDYQANEVGVISLPESYLLRPNHWVGLIHESLHCFFSDNESRFGGSLTKKGPCLRIGFSYHELLVDFFDLHFSPFWSPHLWFQHFWTQVENLVPTDTSDEDYAEATEQAVIRAVFAYYHLYSFQDLPGINLIDATGLLGADYETWQKRAEQEGDHELAALWTSARQKHMQVTGEVQWENLMGDRSDPHDYAERMHETMARHLPFDRDRLEKREAWWKTANLNEILRPDALFDHVDIHEPALFLWKLWDHDWEGGEIPPPQRVVAISALLNAFRCRIRKFFSPSHPESVPAPAGPESRQDSKST